MIDERTRDLYKGTNKINLAIHLLKQGTPYSKPVAYMVENCGTFQIKNVMLFSCMA